MATQSIMQIWNQLHQISEAEWETLIIISQDIDKIAEFSLQDIISDLL